MAVSREAQHSSQKHNGDENMEKGGKKKKGVSKPNPYVDDKKIKNKINLTN